jgi:hypothetical protein
LPFVSQPATMPGARWFGAAPHFVGFSSFAFLVLAVFEASPLFCGWFSRRTWMREPMMLCREKKRRWCTADDPGFVYAVSRVIEGQGGIHKPTEK